MRTAFSVVLALAATLAGAPSAQAGVKVSFVDKQRYTDAQLRGVTVGRNIRAHLQRLGTDLDRSLDLNITVLDIDVAGWDATSRFPEGIRILTSSTWPKVRLRYVLSRKGKVIDSGEELVTDHFYRGRLGMASSDDPLRYEKNMLDDWFRMRFASHLRTGG